MTETKTETVPDATESTKESTKPSVEESTTATVDETPETDQAEKPANSPAPIVSSSKRTRPQYKYDPNKITLRFIFANRDGLTVTLECDPSDTVSEVKGALLSVWPEDLPTCSSGENVRLICMGKGILMPDTRSLEDCQVPVFKTHPTPINVSVRPENVNVASSKGGSDSKTRRSNSNTSGGPTSTSPANETASQGCACTIM